MKVQVTSLKARGLKAPCFEGCYLERESPLSIGGVSEEVDVARDKDRKETDAVTLLQGGMLVLRDI